MKSFKKIIAVFIILFFIFITGIIINFRYIKPKQLSVVELAMPASGVFNFKINGMSTVLGNNINSDKGYTAVLDISKFKFRSKEDVPYLIGDTADARLTDKRVVRFKCEILSITKDEIIVFFDNDEAEVGDDLLIDFGMKSVKLDTILPLSSILYDEIQDEYYVFLVEQYSGAWGNEYKAVKKMVTPLAYYHDEISLTTTFFENTPVILNPEGIFEGELVRFY